MAEILKNAGTYEILSITPDPVKLIELAGRTAYQSQREITEASSKKFVKMLIDKGHESVIEHACMTVLFSLLSRGYTHEQVRHRLVSYTQESTRYVDESDFRVVCPPDKDPDERVIGLPLPEGGAITVSFREWMEMNEQMYRGLRRHDWAPEDARQVLPIGIVSQIVVSANFREWRHIFRLRTAKGAHWEIRGVMTKLLEEVKGRIPVVFDDIEVE